jgi:hypothetical protein
MELEIEQVGKGGLPRLALPNRHTRSALGKASGGRPPFPTCSI